MDCATVIAKQSSVLIQLAVRNEKKASLSLSVVATTYH